MQLPRDCLTISLSVVLVTIDNIYDICTGVSVGYFKLLTGKRGLDLQTNSTINK